MRARGFRVESICRVLTEQGVAVAPMHVPQLEDRRILSAHGHRCSADRRPASHDRYPGGMYGRRKMTAYLRRKGYRVAACSVDRLMRDEGLSGVVRGRHRTTIRGQGCTKGTGPARPRFHRRAAQPQVGHRFHLTPGPGFVYVALVIDCFSRAIVWTCRV